MAALRAWCCSYASLRPIITPKLGACQTFNYSTDEKEKGADDNEKLGGFAKAFIKQQQPEVPLPTVDESFSTLLRNSKFMDLGDPEGKIVTGKVFHVVDNDLYIDFGWKFHTVCTRPARNGEDYVKGSIVRLRIKELELSTKFLGTTKDLTLLEADCTLLGLISSPARPRPLR